LGRVSKKVEIRNAVSEKHSKVFPTVDRYLDCAVVFVQRPD
jgi:hypothetical protein